MNIEDIFPEGGKVSEVGMQRIHGLQAEMHG